MDVLQKVISYLHIWAGGLTAEDWQVAGTIAGSILVTVGLVAWIKRQYLRKNARKLASEFIVLNVAFFGFLLTVTDFIVTQGTAFGSLLPFLNTHWAQISGGAIAVHSVATALHKFWKDRKDGKPLVADELIDGIVDKPIERPAITAPIPPVSVDIWKA